MHLFIVSYIFLLHCYKLTSINDLILYIAMQMDAYIIHILMPLYILCLVKNRYTIAQLFSIPSQ